MTLSRGPRLARTAASLATTAALGLLGLTACSSTQESYCDAVKDHQSRLADVTKGSAGTALITALPIFEDLRSKAPEDIRDDWRTVVTAIQGLEDALSDAGVDPATYDRDHPPAGVTTAERTAIDQAAAGLTQQATVSALAAVQQESLDVCHTPLAL